MNKNIADALNEILKSLDLHTPIPSPQNLMENGVPQNIVKDAIEKIEAGLDALEWCEQYR
jgi:hypothetical protein